MNPIHERRHGQSIGYDTRSFVEQFPEICRSHLREGRAQAFAFIFHGSSDDDLRTILDERGVFVELDRLSGEFLSVFYLSSHGPRAIQRFNSEFLMRLGIKGKVRLPCVVFFRLKNDVIENVMVASLKSSNLIHGFRELYNIIERYIKDTSDTREAGPELIRRWLKSGSQFLTIEAFRAILKSIFEGIV